MTMKNGIIANHDPNRHNVNRASHNKVSAELCITFAAVAASELVLPAPILHIARISPANLCSGIYLISSGAKGKGCRIAP